MAHLVQRGVFNIPQLFLLLLFFRFFTEFLDRELAVSTSPIITVLIYCVAIVIVVNVWKFPKQVSMISLALFFIMISGIASALYVELVSSVDAWKQVYKYSLYALLPMIGYSLGLRYRTAMAFIGVVGLASFISFLYAFFDGITGGASISHGVGAEGRTFGFGSHPVLYGTQIVIVMTFIFFCSNVGLLRWRKLSLMIFLFFGVLALFFTLAKTAWLFFAYILFVQFRKVLHIPNIFVFILMMASIFLLISTKYFSGLESIIDFIRSEDYLRTNNYEYIESSMHWRIVQWVSLFETGLENFYLGVGPSQVVFYNKYGLSAHSSLLDMFVEQGIVGFLSYAYLMLVLILFSFEKQLFKERKLIKAFVISIIIISTFSVSLFNQTMNMMLILLLFGFIWSPLVVHHVKLAKKR
jgi:O-antigen ligase